MCFCQMVFRFVNRSSFRLSCWRQNEAQNWSLVKFYVIQISLPAGLVKNGTRDLDFGSGINDVILLITGFPPTLEK